MLYCYKSYLGVSFFILEIFFITFTSAMLPIKIVYMQNNVNAENVIGSLVANFGDGGAVSTCDGGIIKLQVRELRNGDVLTISNLLQWSDVQVKRSGSGLLIIFIPKPWAGEYSKEVLDALENIRGDIDFDAPPHVPEISKGKMVTS